MGASFSNSSGMPMLVNGNVPFNTSILSAEFLKSAVKKRKAARAAPVQLIDLGLMSNPSS